MKRAYKISLERRVEGRIWHSHDITVVAANAEDALKRARANAHKTTGFAAPWFVKSLHEIGDAI